MNRTSQRRTSAGREPHPRDRVALYRQLLDLVTDAIMLVDSETGRILETNTAATSVYGYSREEWLELFQRQFVIFHAFHSPKTRIKHSCTMWHFRALARINL